MVGGYRDHHSKRQSCQDVEQQRLLSSKFKTLYSDQGDTTPKAQNGPDVEQHEACHDSLPGLLPASSAPAPTAPAPPRERCVSAPNSL
eukprot:3875492-Amphidinium_carterae.1